MTRKITSKTTLKQIQSMAAQDFGISLSHRQAKEIKQAIRDGVALWNARRYLSTRGTDDVTRMAREGVNYMAYRTFYPRQEWNALVKSGQFN